MTQENDDRSAWNAAWGAMRHRQLNGMPSATDVSSYVSYFGEIVSVTIAENPAEYSDKVSRESEACAVCGMSTEEDARLPASVYPSFASGFSHAFGVWVHRFCFDDCPDASEPAPIPW